jgi:hypothetical protein
MKAIINHYLYFCENLFSFVFIIEYYVILNMIFIHLFLIIFLFRFDLTLHLIHNLYLTFVQFILSICFIILLFLFLLIIYFHFHMLFLIIIIGLTFVSAKHVIFKLLLLSIFLVSVVHPLIIYFDVLFNLYFFSIFIFLPSILIFSSPVNYLYF